MLGRGRETRWGSTPSVADKIAGELENLDTMKNLSAERLVEYAEEVGDFLANKVRLKTSQIRRFLDAVTRIKTKSFGNEGVDFERESILLRPKLAYAAGRQDQVKPLMAVLDPCMRKVKDEDGFLNFARFVEAIIAYHRYHGGKD